MIASESSGYFSKARTPGPVFSNRGLRPSATPPGSLGARRRRVAARGAAPGRQPSRSAFRVAAFLVLACGAGHSTAGALPDFVSLVAEHGPAVINVSATRRSPALAPQAPGPYPELPEDSPYREFFRRYFHGNPEEERFHGQAQGSGFIISSDGYIVCNYHVIRDADEVTVRLNDWREFKAEIAGVDERSDIGLLKIDATGLPAVRVGAGNDLQVGEWVLAIGSPFGFEHTVTAGIVSAKGRSLPRENYVPFIQTDVAINPGNSGGPLFNLAGEVVGINSQIFSGTGGFMGLSFAIPIEVAMNVVTQLRERGQVSRGWLGVLIDDVTPTLAASHRMDRPRGAWIAKVLPDGPAALAGLQEGDIVLEFDGYSVLRSSDLPPIVGRTRVGSRVPVRILRGGEVRIVQVLIAELPEEDEIRIAAHTPNAPSTTGAPGIAIGALGIEVVEPGAERRRRWGLPERGVLVTDVAQGPAHRAGLRIGDLILAVDGADVTDAQSLSELSADLARGKAVSILALRRDEIIAFSLEGG